MESFNRLALDVWFRHYSFHYFFDPSIFVPESPRWLASKERWHEAGDILAKVNGKEKAQQELADIKETLNIEKGSFAEIFKPGIRKALMIGVVLCIFSQVTGINTIMYYAPEIFKSTGDATSSALIQTVLVGAINVLFTLVAIKYVDKAGRRALLLIGIAGMAVCLTIVGAAFYFNFAKGYLVLVAILGYIAFFAVSLGPLAFVVIAEIFPIEIAVKPCRLLYFSCGCLYMQFRNLSQCCLQRLAVLSRFGST